MTKEGIPADVKARIWDKLKSSMELVKSIGLDKQVPNDFLDRLLDNSRDFAEYGYTLAQDQVRELQKEVEELKKQTTPSGKLQAATLKDNAELRGLLRDCKYYIKGVVGPNYGVITEDLLSSIDDKLNP